MITLAVILFLFPSVVMAIYGGETVQLEFIDRCDYVNVSITGNLPIVDGEYELIGCSEQYSNFWECSCNNNFSLDMKTRPNTMNTYDYSIEYYYSEHVNNFSLRLKRGWNLVSVPYDPVNDSPEAVFGDCVATLDQYPVKTWDFPLFVTAENIRPKVGYWILSIQDAECTILGKPILDTTMNLERGWNMIGTTGNSSLNMSQIPNQIWAHPPKIWQTPLFREREILQPGQGAWLLVTQDTEVTI